MAELVWAKVGRHQPWPARFLSSVPAETKEGEEEEQEEEETSESDLSLLEQQRVRAHNQVAKLVNLQNIVEPDSLVRLVEFFGEEKSRAYVPINQISPYGGVFTGSREIGVSLPSLLAVLLQSERGEPALRVPAHISDKLRQACMAADRVWADLNGVEVDDDKDGVDGVGDVTMGMDEEVERKKSKDEDVDSVKARAEQERKSTELLPTSRATPKQPSPAVKKGTPSTLSTIRSTSSNGTKGNAVPVSSSGSVASQSAAIRDSLAAADTAMRAAAANGQQPTATLHRKYFIPLEKVDPKINVLAHLAGADGSQLRRVEQDSGCKIFLRGKGSLTPEREAQIAGTPRAHHLSQPLHLVVDNYHPDSRQAETLVLRACGYIEQILDVRLSLQPRIADSAASAARSRTGTDSLLSVSGSKRGRSRSRSTSPTLGKEGKPSKRTKAAGFSGGRDLLRILDLVRTSAFGPYQQLVLRSIVHHRETEDMTVTLCAPLVRNSTRHPASRAALAASLPTIADLCGGVACMLNYGRAGEADHAAALQLPTTDTLHVRHVGTVTAIVGGARQELVVRTMPGSYARLGATGASAGVLSVDVECEVCTFVPGVADPDVRRVALVQVRKHLPE